MTGRPPAGTVTARAPAKVNMHLSVGPLRPDGFHGLQTVYLAVSLFDTVAVSPAGELSIDVGGDEVAAVPTDRRNLVWSAAELLAERAGVPAEAAITIRKAIPVAAGLAGGSADAAAALVALDALWGTHASRRDLSELAAELGSDVPFSLAGGVALGTGRGEVLSPVLAPRRWHWVLGIGDEGLSTPAVYAELDRLREAGRVPGGEDPPSTDPILSALRGGTPAVLAALLSNDLQAAAVSLRPELRRALRAVSDAGAAAGLVSGSGPTIAALAEDEDTAIRLAAALAGLGLFRTVRLAHGPVPGARLVG